MTGYYASETATAPARAAVCGHLLLPPPRVFFTAASFCLEGGTEGAKTVYVWFKDAASNVSSKSSAAITLAYASYDKLKWPDTGVKPPSYTNTFGEDP